MSKQKFTTTFPKKFLVELNKIKTTTGIPISRQLELAWRKQYKLKR